MVEQQNVSKLKKRICNYECNYWTVISISGFGMDNIIMGISGMGLAYVEMIHSFFSRLFSWLLDFFNNRTPQVPKNPLFWWK